jgi:hypothetical protein
MKKQTIGQSDAGLTGEAQISHYEAGFKQRKPEKQNGNMKLITARR